MNIDAVLAAELGKVDGGGLPAVAVAGALEDAGEGANLILDVHFEKVVALLNVHPVFEGEDNALVAAQVEIAALHGCVEEVVVLLAKIVAVVGGEGALLAGDEFGAVVPP